MSLPGVDIEIQDGQVGSPVSVEDAVMGLNLSAPAASGLALSTPKAIFSLAEAEALGIDAAFDVANTVDSYLQIKEFYDNADEGTELWIQLIPQTTTMSSACDKANDIVKKMLDAASGRIKMWGITRVPDGAYVPTNVDGIDDDVSDAVIKAHALCDDYVDQFKPCLALIGARDFQGDVGNLKSFKTNTNHWVGVVLGSTQEITGHPSVGFTLGQFANRPVQRKISRVKDGEVGLTDAYLSDGVAIETYEASMGAIHDKGYIFFRTIAEKTGYFFNSDPATVADTSDFSSLARGRVIQKALRITYATYIDEVEDDIEIDDNGFMNPALVKDYQAKIVTAIELSMKQAGSEEISRAICVIDPAQNVTATGKVTIKKVGVQPRAYSTIISIPNLGFDNPINN